MAMLGLVTAFQSGLDTCDEDAGASSSSTFPADEAEQDCCIDCGGLLVERVHLTGSRVLTFAGAVHRCRTEARDG